MPHKVWTVPILFVLAAAALCQQPPARPDQKPAEARTTGAQAEPATKKTEPSPDPLGFLKDLNQAMELSSKDGRPVIAYMTEDV